MDSTAPPSSEPTAEWSPPATHRNYTYRLKLRACQHRALEALLEHQRLLYNAALQERIDAWSKTRKSISFIDQCRSLTEIRIEDPEGYGALPLNLSRGTLKRLDLAMQAFFRRVKAGQSPGFPRFKPMSRWDSLSFNEWRGIRFVAGGTAIAFAGVPGHLRIRLHRPLPIGAVPKSAILRRERGHWSISILIAVPMIEAAQWSPIEEDSRADIGLDVGIEAFATTSDGIRIPSLNLDRDNHQERSRLQRSLSRKKRGSRRRHAARQRLAAFSARIAARRKDEAHKRSVELARSYRVIAVEDLTITNMSRSAKGSLEEPGSGVKAKAGLNRAILDQGWSDFLFKLSYKAESAGGKVIFIKPHGSSQDCSGCGTSVPKLLTQRMHNCPHCGLSLHRDHNAARNLLSRAAREGKLPARLQPMVGRTGCRENHAFPSNAQQAGGYRSGPVATVRK